MKLTDETKIFVGIIVATIAIIGVAVFAFSRPAPTFTRAELIGDRPQAQGNKDASAYLVEFSDFQCPFCKTFQPVVDQIMKDHGDKLYFVYRHFPLSQHPYSRNAAIAAEAAGVQGKFFDMGRLLFSDQENLSDEKVKQFVRDLGLDEQKFAAAAADKTIADKVQNDYADGLRFGVGGTPTFFLNGQKVPLSSQQDLINAVNAALK